MPKGVYKRTSKHIEWMKSVGTSNKGKSRNKGKVMSKETKDKISKAKKRQIVWWIKKGLDNPMKGKKGKNHPMWKGGITPIHNKIRNSIEMKLFTQAVFARDGYICQKTGIKSNKLTAHHILNFSSHPELRFAIDNGITLSLESHKEFHKKYGKTNNTLEQLEEFLKNK